MMEQFEDASKISQRRKRQLENEWALPCNSVCSLCNEIIGTFLFIFRKRLQDLCHTLVQELLVWMI